MAEVLGWSEEQIGREVESYHARVAAERDSQRQQDDQTADAARLMAPDALAGSQGEGEAGARNRDR
jgi:glycerol-3-phosphate dehydrogenase